MVRYSRARKVNPQNRGKEPSKKPLQPSCDRRDGSTHDIIAHLTRFMVNFNARFCLDARALGIEDTSILYFTSLLLRIDDSLVPWTLQSNSVNMLVLVTLNSLPRPGFPEVGLDRIGIWGSFGFPFWDKPTTCPARFQCHQPSIMLS